MKKIYTLLIALILTLSAFLSGIAAADEASVEILYPKNGEYIACEDTEVIYKAREDFAETVFELDGKVIAKGDCILTRDSLTLGSHTLVIYGVTKDGDVCSAKTEFSVKKTFEKVPIDYDFSSFSDEDIKNGVSTQDLYRSASDKERIYVVCRPALANKVTVSVTEGPEGDGDTAVNLKSAGTLGNNKPFADIKFDEKGGEVYIENDICPNTTSDYIKYSLRSNVGEKLVEWDPLGGNGGNCPFDASGRIFGDSKKNYFSENWYHIRLHCDFNTGKVDFSITDKLSGEQLFERTSSIPSEIKTLAFVRIEYSTASANSGFSLDNVKVVQGESFTGIRNIAFIYGEEASEDVKADVNRLTALKLLMNEPVYVNASKDFFAISDDDGNTVFCKDVSIKGANTVIVTPGEDLQPDKTYRVTVGLGASALSDEISEYDKASVSFETAQNHFGISRSVFTVSGVSLISPLQVRGRSISAELDFANNENGKKSFCCIMTVRSNGLLLDMNINNVTVAENSSDFKIDITSGDLPQNTDNVQIQLIFIDSLSGGKPIIDAKTFDF